MRTLINVLANIVRGKKYSNTHEYKEKGGNTPPTHSVEEDEYGYKHYKKNGLTHKLSGPAIIYRSGTVKYFIEGVELSEADHAEHYCNSTGL